MKEPREIYVFVWANDMGPVNVSIGSTRVSEKRLNSVDVIAFWIGSYAGAYRVIFIYQKMIFGGLLFLNF